MLDFFYIFTQGGVILWSYAFYPIRAFPLNDLISNVLLEEKSGKTSFSVDQYSMKWTFANDHDLVFVAAHPKSISVPYLEALLETAKKAFVDTFGRLIKENVANEFPFDPIFQQINFNFEQSQDGPKVQKTAAKNERSKKSKKGKGGEKAQEKEEKQDEAPEEEEEEEEEEEGEEETPGKPLSKQQIAEKMKNLAKKMGKKKKAPNADEAEAAPEEKKKKVMAEKKGGKLSKKDIESLDYNSGEAVSNFTVPEHLIDKEALEKLKKITGGNFQIPDIEYKPQEEASKDTSATGRLASFFRGITGQKVLERSDLEEPLLKMKDLLITKNVATEIAESLAESVLQSLLGKTISSFTGVAAIVREAMETAMQKILTPKVSTDLLRDILSSKEQKKPFSIVFCGVNGVGKSTNLAKICFWLLQNKLSVLIAAGDTFRSGAVEQLNVHVRNLRALGDDTVRIELFQKGYGKDPAGIAKDAINYAKSQSFDVVLIDTAGRMQDDEPLMRALAKLVKMNNPNKIFFVGEALVGNRGVDQLVKFNRAFRDHSDLAEPRLIDGIVLTKFDTIDDKVGAALSMTYITGQPIVFVGTGQTYTDLKKLNVKAVVDSLLS